MPDDVVELHRPAADARSSARRARRRRVIIVLSALIGAFAAWEAITRVVAYTGDAYVRSDLVAVSPEVTGHIVAVHVQDNQTIRRGEILISIDPVPFQLAVDASQAALKEANAQATTDRAVVAMANDGVADAEARLKYAQETQYSRGFGEGGGRLTPATRCCERSAAARAGGPRGGPSRPAQSAANVGGG